MEKRRRLTPAERRAVYDKMGGRCAYCGEQLNYEDMQVDHVVALRSKGEDDLANMLPACRSCNHYAGWGFIRSKISGTVAAYEPADTQNSDAEESQRGNNKAFGLEKLLHILHTLLFCCYIKPIR